MVTTSERDEIERKILEALDSYADQDKLTSADWAYADADPQVWGVLP